MTDITKEFAALFAELEQHPDHHVEKLSLALAHAIHKRMTELGISQRELAKRLGTSQAHVSKLLAKERNLTVKSLAQLAYAMDAHWSEPQLVPNTPSGTKSRSQTKSQRNGANAKKRKSVRAKS